MIHLMEVQDLQKLIAQEAVNLIDVREKMEYNESNIPGAVLIPLGTLTFEQVKNIAKNGKKIVIHCKSGGRSMRACQMLMEYDNELEVYNLEGGIIAWNFAKNIKESGGGSGSCAGGKQYDKSSNNSGGSCAGGA